MRHFAIDLSTHLNFHFFELYFRIFVVISENPHVDGRFVLIVHPFKFLIV
ncbi:hypothetical protein RICGR_1102 [Rickettsiella grylli]|uniref:Uncharacterized protein n=1 Tax=Rickettsiella grylli TaxID=59196 RepID=A8PNS7_9COXI|nr:hypothetical protein RICGR_1102 [Rickettsiella grylli]